MTCQNSRKIHLKLVEICPEIPKYCVSWEPSRFVYVCVCLSGTGLPNHRTDRHQTWSAVCCISQAASPSHHTLGLRPFWGRTRGPTLHLLHMSVAIYDPGRGEKKSVGVDIGPGNPASQTAARPVNWWPAAITKLEWRVSGWDSFNSENINVFDPPPECLVSMKCEISLESRQDHLHVNLVQHLLQGTSGIISVLSWRKLITPAKFKTIWTTQYFLHCNEFFQSNGESKFIKSLTQTSHSLNFGNFPTDHFIWVK